MIFTPSNVICLIAGIAIGYLVMLVIHLTVRTKRKYPITDLDEKVRSAKDRSENARTTGR